MGERKTLNKYYPPDFDPSKLPRTRRAKNNQIKVRTMLPMTIRCNLCRSFINRGTKVNARKEDAVGERYLGSVQVYRFYFKCTNCSSEIAIKTDPQNSDYAVESGAKRHFEPYDIEPVGDNDPCGFEKRSMDSERTMQNLAFLEDLKSVHDTVTVDAMLEALKNKKDREIKRLEHEDEALIKSIDFPGSRNCVRRRVADEDDDQDLPSRSRQKLSDLNHPAPTVSNLVRFVRSKPEKVDKNINATTTVLDSLRLFYNDDDD